MSLYLARMCLQKKFRIILCFIGWLQLEFSVRRVQMNFLHLLSAGAEQRITIHCLNMTIWSHAPSEPLSQNAVWFQAWTGETLEPDVLADTCWVSVPFKKLATTWQPSKTPKQPSLKNSHSNLCIMCKEN